MIPSQVKPAWTLNYVFVSLWLPASTATAVVLWLKKKKSECSNIINTMRHISRCNYCLITCIDQCNLIRCVSSEEVSQLERSHTPLLTSLDSPSVDGSNMDASGTPTSPPPASGNGVITQPKKVRGIGFGDIFSEGSLKLKVRLPSPDTEEKKERVSVWYKWEP